MSSIIIFTFACTVPARASLSMADEAAYQYDSMTVLFGATISISGCCILRVYIKGAARTLNLLVHSLAPLAGF